MTSNNTPKIIHLRSYQSEDSDACELLETRANQHKNAKIYNLPIVGAFIERSIQVHTVHHPGFDAMAKTAEEYEIIVAEETSANPPTIIGVVLVNIRTVFWAGTPIKVGWVYGLRVDVSHQREGIATLLSKEVELRCRKRGVSKLILSVNLDNSKAFSLYKKLDYKHASHRAPASQFLIKHQKVSEDLMVFQIPPTLAAALMAKKYDKLHMSPAPSTRDGFLKLLESSNFETTFLAVKRSGISSKLVKLLESNKEKEEIGIAIEEAIQNGEVENYGGVSLLNGSSVKRFKVVRLLFSKDTWLSLPFQASLAAFLLWVMCGWYIKLIYRVIAAVFGYNDLSLWHEILIGAECLACLSISKIVFKVVTFFRLLVTRDTSSLVARAFSPFSHGPMGIDCLRGAIVASQNYSLEKGYGLWLMNVDADHPDSVAFPKPGFRTRFLQKWIRTPPSVDGGGKVYGAIPPTAFCDPRDM